MTGLLRKLLIDVPSLTENTIVPLRVSYVMYTTHSFMSGDSPSVYPKMLSAWSGVLL
jgi:hypothetical protein